MASSTVIASPHKRLLDRHTQKKLAGIGRVIMILLIMIIVVLPFYVAVLYSFRAPDAITANRLAWPEHPTFQNYLRVIFENESFLTGYKNSIINTLPTVVLLMVITSMASWVLARHETRFYNFMYAILTLGLLIPFQCFELPLYINWYNAGLVSTNIGFIVARAGNNESNIRADKTGVVPVDVQRQLKALEGNQQTQRQDGVHEVIEPCLMARQNPACHGGNDHQQHDRGQSVDDAVLVAGQEAFIFKNDPQIVLEGRMLRPRQAVGRDGVRRAEGVQNRHIERQHHNNHNQQNHDYPADSGQLLLGVPVQKTLVRGSNNRRTCHYCSTSSLLRERVTIWVRTTRMMVRITAAA